MVMVVELEPIALSRWVPDGFSVWDFLNSNLLVALVGLWFTTVFKKDSDRRQVAEAKKSETDEATLDAEALTVAEGKNNFVEAAKLVDDLKQRTEKRIAETKDGRHKRTYSKITRYDYVPLIDAMMDRGLDPQIAELAKKAFNIYKPYKNGRREIPSDILKKLQDIMSKLDELNF